MNLFRSRKSRYQPMLCLSRPPGGPLNASDPNQLTPLMEKSSPLAYILPPRASNSNTPAPREALARFGCATMYTRIQTRTMTPRMISLHHCLSGVGLPSSGLVSLGPAAATDFLCFLCFLGFLASVPSTGCFSVGFGAAAGCGEAKGFEFVAGLGAAAGFGAADGFGFGSGTVGVRAVAGFGAGLGAAGFGPFDWAALGAAGFDAAGLVFGVLASGFGMTGASSFVSPSAVRCDGFAGLTAAGFRFAGARGNGAPAFFLPPPNTRPSAMRAEDRHGPPPRRVSARRAARVALVAEHGATGREVKVGIASET